MPSVIAKIKSRVKRMSHGSESAQRPSRHSLERPSEDSSVQDEDLDVNRPLPAIPRTERPPQIPALDFSRAPTSETNVSPASGLPNASSHQPSNSAAASPVRQEHGVAKSSLSAVDDAARLSVNPLASSWNPETSPVDHLSKYLGRMSLTPKLAAEEFHPFDTPELVRQREAFVQQIAADIRARRAGQVVTDEGRRVFQAGGLGETLGLRDTIEVHTRWLPPVVHEHIIRQELAVYMTVIDREIHKYHIYPKIQPVSDPDPIQLEPRHRLFDAETGLWHEVVGDAAAIAILGEDAFRNGKKEKRVTRAMALPGFGAVASMTAEERRKHGLGMVDEYGAWIDDTEEVTTLVMEI